MTSPILVTGGTGTLGRRVVPRLRAAGRDVRVLSRHGRADEDGIRCLTGDLATGEGPVVPVPAGWRVQPIDPGEVADRLVALALGAPAGLVAEVGGPRIYELAALVRGYLRAGGTRRPILPVRLPGNANRAYRAGANLAPHRAVGRRTWEDFLAERVSPGTRSSGGQAGPSVKTSPQ